MHASPLSFGNSTCAIKQKIPPKLFSHPLPDSRKGHANNFLSDSAAGEHEPTQRLFYLSVNLCVLCDSVVILSQTKNSSEIIFPSFTW